MAIAELQVDYVSFNNRGTLQDQELAGGFDRGIVFGIALCGVLLLIGALAGG